ncbi:MAG TPA: response regulator transcription factor [Candidatus Baltobacteraceae bacterium]|jgi:DNA-binding NarL/FixJ family response regulator|nr:response regulator transcription factor [Candidatus Baltobacteraceae bacterium]
MIRLVLVDDHPIVLDGIALNLEDVEDVVVVGRASSASEALSLIGHAKPDVLVLDLELPDRNGGEVLRDAKRILPSLHVVVFTAYSGRERVCAALESGADSYILKGTPSSELLEAIRTVAQGRPYLPAAISSELIGAFRESGRERLTEREREILRLLAEGFANKEIGVRLNIAERTVKFHVSGILARLGVSNRAHAVAVAQKLGLV